MDEDRKVPDLRVKTTDGMCITLCGVEEINVNDGIITFSDEHDDEIAMIPVDKILWIVKSDESAKIENQFQLRKEHENAV